MCSKKNYLNVITIGYNSFTHIIKYYFDWIKVFSIEESKQVLRIVSLSINKFEANGQYITFTTPLLISKVVRVAM